MTAPRICVVGSSNVDLTFRTPRLPRLGETLTGHGCQLGFGGKGANQAVTAARLGAQVAMIGKVGRDVFGEQTLEHFRHEGIDITHVRSDADHPTGTAAILVDDEARNCIIVAPGANHRLTPQDVRDAAEMIREADLLICQLETPMEATREALQIAREAGVATLFNPAPAAELPDELLSFCDLCVPNEPEAELLTGLPVTNREEAEAAVLALRERGAATVIVTLGSQGALVADGQGNEFIQALKVAAVDSTGAGDAFIGSLAVYLGEGNSLREAVRRANAVAALSVTRPGTQSSFPTRAEVGAFMGEEQPA
jgi:ribokinase